MGYGSTRFQRAEPHLVHVGVGAVCRVVAVQVAFERQTLKPAFSLDML
jgi:hypothetical protein